MLSYSGSCTCLRTSHKASAHAECQKEHQHCALSCQVVVVMSRVCCVLVMCVRCSCCPSCNTRRFHPNLTSSKQRCQEAPLHRQGGRTELPRAQHATQHVPDVSRQNDRGCCLSTSQPITKGNPVLQEISGPVAISTRRLTSRVACQSASRSPQAVLPPEGIVALQLSGCSAPRWRWWWPCGEQPLSIPFAMWHSQRLGCC